MDSVRFCAAKLGYTVIDRRITSKVELEVIARVCAKDKTKFFVFSDEDDVKKIQGWREGFGNNPQECHTACMWDSLVYHISKSDKPKTLRELYAKLHFASLALEQGSTGLSHRTTPSPRPPPSHCQSAP